MGPVNYYEGKWFPGTNLHARRYRILTYYSTKLTYHHPWPNAEAVERDGYMEVMGPWPYWLVLLISHPKFEEHEQMFFDACLAALNDDFDKFESILGIIDML